jgi:hypothetical protein
MGGWHVAPGSVRAFGMPYKLFQNVNINSCLGRFVLCRSLVRIHFSNADGVRVHLWDVCEKFRFDPYQYTYCVNVCNKNDIEMKRGLQCCV